MNTEIKKLLLSKGWAELEQLILTKANNLCDCRTFSAKTAEEKGIESIASAKAVDLINKILKEVKKEPIKPVAETKYI